ncbi:MAG TPA: hypothetical protein VE953_28530 [Terriglobales bacterium]|nr:hypothetical protein [Terriglobales bacterium]
MSQAGGGNGGYTYSPDGRWWWDGQRWQPVGAAPRGGLGTTGRWLVAAVIVMIVAMTLPLGLTAAIIGWRVSHVSPPSALASAPVLPDATETGIERAATSQGLQCERPPVYVGFGRPTIHSCHRTAGGGLLSVDVIGPDDSRVTMVHAAAVGPRLPDQPTILALFQSVVGAAVAVSDVAPDDEWVSAHLGQPGTSLTTLHGVALQLQHNGSVRSLSIQAVPY